MTKTTITPELARAALVYIPANCDRDTWSRVAMAIKSEFPDATGQDLFTDWSASADGYDSKAARQTWRSVKAGGGVTIATLLHLAKEHGFELPKGNQVPAPPSPEQLAQRERERVESRRLDQARTDAAHALAADAAAVYWEQAGESGASAYLERKGVQAHGVRFAADGVLLVPMRDEAGRLWSVQRIAGTKPADGPDKLYGAPGSSGSRKVGLWHLVGDVAADPAGPAVLLVAEGYATAATVHEATGHPVACAFDSGNLAHVARALHKLHPDVLIVIAGDDDVQTHARTGKNPGRDKATAAARAVHGLAVFPAPLLDGGSDFNDLHHAAGLDAVARCFDAVVTGHLAAQAAAREAKAASSGESGQPVLRASGGAPVDVAGDAVDMYRVTDTGIWFHGIDQEGKPKREEWICSRMDVEALTRDQDGGGWGYLLTFADPLGNPKRWAMPARMLAGDGGEYRAMLLNMGLRIATSPRARNLLTQYIQTRHPAEFASCTERIGWHGPAFVLPHETIGDEAERIVFQTDRAIENAFRIKGTAEQWRDRVGLYCVGNSRMLLTACTAFAGPLLRPAGMESGGVHIHGDGSTGKTTALRVGVSLYGGESFKRTWQGTGVGFEVVAAASCDTALFLDELKECEPKVVSQVIYMLGNQQGKMRGNAGIQMRPMVRWILPFVSTGELTVEQHLASAGLKTHEGQNTRLANIPADAGAGLGIFEQLHEHESGAAFAKYIGRATAATHGAVGRLWIEKLCANADTLRRQIREAVAAVGPFTAAGASGQVERVGARFALFAAAGEMASAFGLTGWPPGEATRGVKKCFEDWLAARGGNGNGESLAMLRAVRRFLENHGEGRFTWWHRGADDHNAKTLQRAGFRRMLDAHGQPIKSNSQHAAEFGDGPISAAAGEEVSVEYFILPETFRAEVCNGFDYKTVCGVLLQHDCLLPDKGAAWDCKPRLPGMGSSRCYRIPPKIFDIEL